MTDSRRLLTDYAQNGSEPAFRELVSRYIDLVYSAAVRLVDGDTHLAEDVAQTVFLDLAQKARTLASGVMLGGWLHRHTCFVAAKTMRGERRRRFRERRAVEMSAQQDHSEANLAQVASILDEAINQLGAEDRTAILLRYFEQRDLRSVGQALGSSENAAQKRVARAIEELRCFLKRRGGALSAGALATALASEAVTAAPAGLATHISVTALACAATGGGGGLTLFNIMTMTKVKLGIITAVVAAGVATPLVVQQRAQARLVQLNQGLRQQVDHLARENARLSNLEVQANDARALSKDQLSELMKLRGEVGLLRKQTNELDRLRQENRQLHSSQASVGRDTGATQIDSNAEMQKQEGIAKLNYAKYWVLAFYLYAEKNQGQFPVSLDQAAPFLPDEAKVEANLAADESLPYTPKFGLTPDRFEVVYQGALADIANPASIIVFREKQAWPRSQGGWNRAYGFADGHSEIHVSQDGNFEAWEQQHMYSPAARAQ